jgi:hypothetical protein
MNEGMENLIEIENLKEKLDKIKKSCEQCIDDSNEAIEEVTDGSEYIYEGRMEFAEQILSLIESEK